ncbi:MAG: helix-turn-helix transcriptional regulator [Polyangiaceae bacterium]|nr:helix-turn-helix transcriptional regulator [Polyangiaceae bacterium]
MASPFGSLLRTLRSERSLSQLGLASMAQVSTRHVSFLETGRSFPSREMVQKLGNVLDLPLRDRNALLDAAGFAKSYRETRLDDPSMTDVWGALEMILRRNEPFGAVALDRYWNLVVSNAGYAHVHAVLTGHDEIVPYRVETAPKINVLRALFAPGGLRRHVVNWSACVRAMLPRIEREAHSRDRKTRELADELLAYEGVAAIAREQRIDVPPLVVPVELRVGETTIALFSTLTTLGTPQDVTLQELRIESFHPANAESEAAARSIFAAMAVEGPSR